MLRIEVFSDAERRAFIKKKARIYPKDRRIIFNLTELRQFLGVRAAAYLCQLLGGKVIRPVKSLYEKPDAERKGRKWFRITQGDLQELIGENATKIYFKYLTGFYVYIPKGKKGLGEVYTKKIKIIDMMERGKSKKEIANILGISQSALSHFIKKHLSLAIRIYKKTDPDWPRPYINPPLPS